MNLLDSKIKTAYISEGEDQFESLLNTSLQLSMKTAFQKCLSERKTMPTLLLYPPFLECKEEKGEFCNNGDQLTLQYSRRTP